MLALAAKAKPKSVKAMRLALESVLQYIDGQECLDREVAALRHGWWPLLHETRNEVRYALGKEVTVNESL